MQFKNYFPLLFSVFFLTCTPIKNTTENTSQKNTTTGTQINTETKKNNNTSTAVNTKTNTGTTLSTDAKADAKAKAKEETKIKAEGASSVTGKIMKASENSMLAEINLMRADPPAYVAQIETYLMAVQNDPSWNTSYKNAEMEAGKELIELLRKTPKLSQLKESEGLYKAAVKHGKDVQKQSKITHQGADGTQPFDRIQKYAPTMVDGSENLVSGATDFRDGLIVLLVDSGVPGKGHRVNLLSPKWQYAACYEIGIVDGLDGSWIQLFGTESKKANALEEVNKAPIEEGPADYSFMSADEKSMIEEINLMRGNPRGYIPYVEAYLEEFRKAGWDALTTADEVSTTKELIAVLKKLEPLSILRPHKELFNVAKLHGTDLKQMGKIQHKGSDGSMPYNRVIQGTDLSDGNENIVGGTTFVRESVITLLVDSGIPNRGHRTTLLNPDWNYVACYRIGQVGIMPNTWLQVFGAR